MKYLKLKFKWLFVLAAVLLLTAGVSLAVEDTYYVEVDTTGQVISGGGSGYGLGGGVWYYYPLTDWWNQWFYNAPYDENRRKEMSVSLTIQPLDRQFPGFAEIAYNWSTGDWSALGNNRPPLPTDFTSPDIEDKYIRRSTFYTGTFIEVQQITDRFEIPDYNPEWVSIDLRGENFQIVEGDGWINHRCLPKVNPEIKWLQAPDITKKGIDIRCDRLDGLNRVLADDFQCESPGAITSVVLWGSWKNDIKGRIKKIHLSIHKDIPDPDPSEPETYSMPGEELWSMNFVPLEYLHYDLGPEEYEWWWDPVEDVDPNPQGDQKIWRYEIDIDPEDAFYQEGTEDNPIVYWLDVYAILDPCVPGTEGTEFGWKTSDKHWNDDAVFSSEDDIWKELRYPFIHPSYPNSIDMAFMIVTTAEPEHDLGDAPDSSNSYMLTPMTAYPSTGVMAKFPTVYRIGSPPFGPIHWQPKVAAYLGSAVSLENEADLPPDEDGVTNIDPLNDKPDLDGNDDGVHFPIVMSHCQPTTFDYDVTIVPLISQPLYVNAWFDWNQDGDWDDTLDCTVAAAPEWAVRNQQVMIVTGPGTYTITTPSFLPWILGDVVDPNIWMRITLSEQQWSPSAEPYSGGCGPSSGYQYGETEDYYFVPKPTDEFDFGDAPERPYPTTLAVNGARHLVPPVITPPCLGNWVDIDADGQPDPVALGDDNDGNDDEDGVVFTSPLIPGKSAKVDVTANKDGFLNAWVDFNGNGSWADTGDQIFTDKALNAGLNTLTFNVPFSATANIATFARFRFNTTGGLGFDGPAQDGEVEDHVVNIEKNRKIKWIQLPDLTPTGIDIRVDDMRWLADDFECWNYGLITDVHLWGSWKYDDKGEITRIHLSIHSDDPAGSGGTNPDNKYSQPDRLLWQQDFFPGEFKEMFVAKVEPGEYWWDPPSGDFIQNGDSEVWRIDIKIDPEEAFLQKGFPDEPVIYWLDVQVDTNDGDFGWKTRRWPDHDIDDAVWDYGSELPRTWKELRYPQGHPYSPNSIDMAFVITGQTELKWTQGPVPWPTQPNTYIGWDEESHNLLPIMVADDFFCDSNRPVTAIRWWGSFEGYNDDVVPEGSVPDYFYITIWDDIPASADVNYSRPNEVIWENYCRTFDVSYFGQEFDPRAGTMNLSKFMFEQELKPSDYWYQPNDNGVYWLGIMAVYEDAAAPPMFPWGWETRPHFYNDDAVRIFADPRDGGWPYPADRIVPIKLDFVTWDLSFELLTRGRACWECPFWALGDSDGDGFVNAGDVVPIINNFGMPASAYPCADLDSDGFINAGDVVPIINNFGAGDGNACPP